MPGDRLWSWLATGAIVLIAAILRFIGLAKPPGKIFDEIYYATEAHDLLNHGVAWDANNNSGGYVVHPPLGKWLIAIGEKLFGYHEFGWRFMPAVAGVLSVLLVIRIGRRLFRSTILGCTAGLLMALDGMHLVLSRSALLDIFLMTFILAAFGALVLDRDARRLRWLRAIESGVDPSRRGAAGRPRFTWRDGVPWWRLVAAVMIGCALSVKWSAVWYLLLFVVLIYLWESGARKSAGVRHRWRDTLLDETGWVAVFGVIVVAVYLASWTGWFLTDAGWDRHWLASVGQHETPFIGALRNLWHYHAQALDFHFSLDKPHPYQSWPWQWLLLGRPVAFYWSSAGTCGTGGCAAEVLLLGTPVLWWSFIPALLAAAWFGISRRDWRAAAVLLGALAGIVPWFPSELDHRTMFYFYALPAEPFLVLTVAYVLGALVRAPARLGRAARMQAGRWLAPADRRLYGAVAAGVYVLLVAACFAYFYPIYVGTTIPYADWFHRMWLGNRWI